MDKDTLHQAPAANQTPNLRAKAAAEIMTEAQRTAEGFTAVEKALGHQQKFFNDEMAGIKDRMTRRSEILARQERMCPKMDESALRWLPVEAQENYYIRRGELDGTMRLQQQDEEALRALEKRSKENTELSQRLTVLSKNLNEGMRTVREKRLSAARFAAIFEKESGKNLAAWFKESGDCAGAITGSLTMDLIAKHKGGPQGDGFMMALGDNLLIFQAAAVGGKAMAAAAERSGAVDAAAALRQKAVDSAKNLPARITAVKEGIKDSSAQIGAAFRRQFGKLEEAFGTNAGTNHVPKLGGGTKPFSWDNFKGTGKQPDHIHLMGPAGRAPAGGGAGRGAGNRASQHIRGLNPDAPIRTPYQLDDVIENGGGYRNAAPSGHPPMYDRSIVQDGDWTKRITAEEANFLLNNQHTIGRFSEAALDSLRKLVASPAERFSVLRWDGPEANFWRALRFQAVTTGLQVANSIDFGTDVGKVKTLISQTTDKAVNDLVQETFASFATARAEVDGVIRAAEQSAKTKVAAARQTLEAAVQIAGTESPANKVYGDYLSQLPKHLQLTRGLVMQKVALERQRSGRAAAQVLIDPSAAVIVTEPREGNESDARRAERLRSNTPDGATLYGQLNKVHQLNALYMISAPQLLYGATASRPSQARVAASNTLLTPQQKAEARQNATLPEAADPLTLTFGLESNQPGFADERFGRNPAGREEQALQGQSPAAQISVQLSARDRENIKNWLSSQKQLVQQLNLSMLELRRRSGYIFKEGEARDSEQRLFNALKIERSREAGEYVKGVMFAAALGEWSGEMPKSGANLAAVQAMTGKSVQDWLAELRTKSANAESRTRELNDHLSPSAGRTSMEGYFKVSPSAPAGLATPGALSRGQRDPLQPKAQLDNSATPVGPAAAASILPTSLTNTVGKVIGPNGLHIGVYGPLAAWNLSSIAKTQYDSEYLKTSWESEANAYTAALKAVVGPEAASVAAQWAKNDAKIEANALEQYAEYASNYYKNQSELVKAGNKQNFQNAMTHLIGRVRRDPAHDDAWQARATTHPSAYTREANAIIEETNRIMDHYYNSLNSIVTDQIRNVPLNPLMPVLPGIPGNVQAPQPARPKVDLVKPPQGFRE